MVGVLDSTGVSGVRLNPGPTGRRHPGALFEVACISMASDLRMIELVPIHPKAIWSRKMKVADRKVT